MILILNSPLESDKIQHSMSRNSLIETFRRFGFGTRQYSFMANFDIIPLTTVRIIILNQIKDISIDLFQLKIKQIHDINPSIVFIELIDEDIIDTQMADFSKASQIKYRLTFPFETQEVIDTIKYILDKHFNLNVHELGVGRIKLDSHSAKVTIDNLELNLTPAEFRILYFIASNYPEAVDTQHILDSCFDPSKGLKPGNITTHICGLNRAANKLIGTNIVKGKRGKGYQLIAM